jgi:hypothetical protein
LKPLDGAKIQKNRHIIAQNFKEAILAFV